MQYMRVVARGDEDCFVSTYYVGYHSLLSKSDIFNYVGTLATQDLIEAIDEEDALDAGFNLEDEDISAEEFDYCLLDYEKVREKVRLSVLGFPHNDIFVCYKIYKEDMTNVPRYVIASASCGQDQSIRSLGCVDVDTPFEEEYDRLRNDLLYQLKKYTDISGTLIVTGVFVIEEIDEEEYQDAVREEELVLV